MKVLNLDKFRNRTIVSIDGMQYEVKGMTVSMYLHDTDFENLSNISPSDTKGQVEAMVLILSKLSSIPKEVLEGQEFNVLATLMSVAQGKDVKEPVEELPEGDAGSPNE